MTTFRADRPAWLAAAVLVLTAMLDGPALAADEPLLVILKNHQFSCCAIGGSARDLSGRRDHSSPRFIELRVA